MMTGNHLLDEPSCLPSVVFDNNAVTFEALTATSETDSKRGGTSNPVRDDQNRDGGETSNGEEEGATGEEKGKAVKEPPSKSEEVETTRRFGQRIINLGNRMADRLAASTSAVTLASEAAATKAAKAEKEQQPSGVEKEMESLQDTDLESMRASQISVTIVKEQRDSYGFALKQVVEGNKEFVEIDLLVEEGLLLQSPLKAGDILRTVNNKKVTNCAEFMEDLVAMDGLTTLVVDAYQGNPNIVQAFCRKPSKESRLGIGFHTLKHGDCELLQINHLDSNGLLCCSVLSHGDLVLAINGIPCVAMSPEEAAALILESTSTVTIIALNPRLANREHGDLSIRAQRWMRSAKRVGIAIGGGTMVGVGLIFIPTLPPPFGEMLIVGGVGVLGTEFEAPKRLVRCSRDSLELAVGRTDPAIKPEGEQGYGTLVPPSYVESSQLEGDAAGQPIESFWSHEATRERVDDEALAAAVASTLSSNSAPPKRTMKDRMKSLGRNYVLPFLDQVVGDHKPEDVHIHPII